MQNGDLLNPSGSNKVDITPDHIPFSCLASNIFSFSRNVGLKYLTLTFILLQVWGFTSSVSSDEASVMGYIKTEFHQFASSTIVLGSAIDRINSGDPQTIEDAKAALTACRLQYKKTAFFLEYFFSYAAVNYNAPAKVEIEEPTLEFNEPTGLQVIESLLFEDDVASKKFELQQHAKFIQTSAGDLTALLYNFRLDDRQLLESLRLELIRVITLNIAGFDAPLLKSGIQESYTSLSAIQYVLQFFIDKESETSHRLVFHLEGARKYLEDNPDFDSFDRLVFLTDNALPLQFQLNQFIKEKQLALNTSGVLDYGAENIFSSGALNVHAFPGNARAGQEELRVALGKRLFSEKALSGNLTRSCATCHLPQKYFSEAMPQSLAFDEHSFLPRNAPTLLYAAFQHNQFWDGRAASLEEQIEEVIANPVEMNGNAVAIVKQLETAGYLDAFEQAFPQVDNHISMDHVASAIAAFIRTLQPMDSRFDQYIRGNKNALNSAEKRGFNLFMGKAQCGTCHFAPMFNGLLPPLYRISEVEVLGVPKTDDLVTPEQDDDHGRFNVHRIEFQRGAFKTPTVRNIALTGPYMHNGSLGTLEAVMDFYNKGGGLGLGMPVPNQTLADMPLNLTESEIKDVIEFLHALTDSPQSMRISGISSPK